MSSAVEEYVKLVERLGNGSGVSASQMFGKPCLKINGKAFVAQHKDVVVFKLTGSSHQKALATKGAELWDPSGKGRPMKEWVAMAATESKSFQALAAAAQSYVATGA